MSCAGNAVRIEEIKNAYKSSVGNLKERDHLGNLVLKLTVKKEERLQFVVEIK
jgi:hypothetical protein